jgi:hypothetical protein
MSKLLQWSRAEDELPLMIDRFLFGATGLALASLFATDRNFALNVDRAFSDPITMPSLEPLSIWEMSLAGGFLILAAIAVYRELRK